MAATSPILPTVATAAAVVVAVATCVLVARESTVAHAVTTGVSTAVTAVAILSLLAAGIAGTRVARLAHAGTLCALVVVTWLAPVWAGWHAGPHGLRILSGATTVFVVPVLVHLVLLTPAGRLTRGRRIVAGSSYLVTSAIAVGLAVTRNPFRDIGCWNDCAIVGALAPSPVAAATLATTWQLLTPIVGASALVWWAVLLARRPRERGWTAAVTGPAALSLGGASANGVLRLAGVREATFDPGHSAVYLATTLALGLIGGGILWTMGATRRRRRAVLRLSDTLSAAPRPGTLEAALRTAVGDPGLRVAYRLAYGERYVDASGRPVDVGPHAVTVRRGDEVLAMVELDRAAPDTVAAIEGIGAAARLTIDNERLLAESAAQLAELRESRRRIVDASDAARHRVERDLHDSAQASLVAALFALSVAASDDPHAESLAVQARSIAAELRELTHGIYPAALDDLGLDAALRALLDTTPHPVRFSCALAKRPDAAVERAVFAVVRRILAIAAPTSIAIDWDGTGVRLAVEGLDSDVGLEHVEDRIGAVGGVLVRGTDGVTATIPT